MSDTPRTDAREFAAIELKPSRVVYASFARQLELELAEARAEIERLVLEIENKQYTITCAAEENQQLKESLAEARAEIERKDRLIGQMREALVAAKNDGKMQSAITYQLIKAALSAAERGEG